MNTYLPAFRSTHSAMAMVGAVIGGLLMSSLPALALEPATPAPEAVQAVTVVAPHVVREKAGGTGLAGGPIEVLSLSRVVSYADLDLTTQAGVAEFQKRIHDAAQTACDQIAAQYPAQLYIPTPANQDCVGAATDGAMPQARQVIAAAQAK